MWNFSAAFKQSPLVIMWVLVVVVITAAIETDIFVPSFPAIKTYFNTSESMVQLIVGINFVGLCLSSLVYGPLTDTYGRRKILLVGNLIFLLGSVGCILSETIETLLIWRFIQGLGTSAVFIVPGAIFYDIFDKEQAAKNLGWFSALITFSMACAPMLGSFINDTWGWQANFILIGILSLLSFFLTVFFIGETLTPEKRMPLHFKEISCNYFKILTSKKTFWYMIIICCLFAGELIFITNMSLIFIDHLQVSNQAYSYYQGAVLLSFAVISYFTGGFIMRFGLIPIRNLGFALTIFGGFSLLLVAFIAPTNPLLITLTMCIYCIGFALCCGILFGDYMEIFPHIKGLASAMASFVRLLFISLMIVIAGLLFNGTIVPVAIMIAMFCAIIIVAWSRLQKM